MAEVFSDDTSAYTFAVRSDHPPSTHILQPCRCFLNPLFFAHNRWRGKAGGPHQLVVTMEDLAGPQAVPMRIPRPKRNNSRRQQTAAAEQQQTVAATARPVAARWKHKAAAAQRGRWRRGGNGGNTCEIRGPRPYGQGLRFRVASAARGNEINTAMRSNASLTCRLAVF
jgi:hypothetical protein